MVYINIRKVLSFSCIGLLVILIFSGCHSRKEVTKISDLAYDENKESGYTVYIQENSKYVPYLVLTNNYNGNTLLLRKDILDELRAYNDYFAYYKDSIIDKYLNNEFYNLLGEKEYIKSVKDATIKSLKITMSDEEDEKSLDEATEMYNMLDDEDFKGISELKNVGASTLWELLDDAKERNMDQNQFIDFIEANISANDLNLREKAINLYNKYVL